MMFTPDGMSAAVREIDCTVRLWDLGAADAFTLRGSAGFLGGAESAPDVGLVICARWDGW
jgi:hypothetical protein